MKNKSEKFNGNPEVNEQIFENKMADNKQQGRFFRLKIVLFSLISFLLLNRCAPRCYNSEEYLIKNNNFQRSIVEIQGFVVSGTSLYHLHYRFKVADTLVKQVRFVGSSVNTDLVRFYAGSRFEIFYHTENPFSNVILLNKPVFDENTRFEKANGRIELISIKQYRSFLWEGCLYILCRYRVNGREYIHRGGISKDLFFPEKDYNEITRKEIRQLNRKYKGKSCEIEYDVNNPGASRLIENSIVSNE